MCEYCEEKTIFKMLCFEQKIFELIKFKISTSVVDGYLHMMAENDDGYLETIDKIKIDFCPMCGRKL